MKSAKYFYILLCMILVVQGCGLFEEEDPKVFTTYITTIGGNGFDLATDVIEADDGYIISGAVGPQCDIVDGLIAKIDKETGSTLSFHTFGNPNQGFEENFFSIAKVGNSYRAVGFSLHPNSPDSDRPCKRDSDDGDGKIFYGYLSENFETPFFDTLEQAAIDSVWEAGYYISEAPDGKVFISGSWEAQIAIVQIEGDDKMVEVVNVIKNSGVYGDGRTLLFHSNGRTYITGKWHNSTGGWGKYRAYLAEVDFENNEFINQHFFEFLDRGIGGWTSSNVESIIETPDGNLFLVGSLDGNIDTETRQIYCLKTDQSGNELSFDVLEIGFKDQVDQIIRVEDGFVIAGNSFRLTNGTTTDILIAKLDFDGKIIWKSCLDYNNNTDVAKSIIQTSDGGFVVVGRTTNEVSKVETMLMAKTDAAGKVEGLDCSCE